MWRSVFTYRFVFFVNFTYYLISSFLLILTYVIYITCITGKSWDEIEKELLSGQKLYASILLKQINEILKKRGVLKKFPLFDNLYKIAYEGETGLVLLN